MDAEQTILQSVRFEGMTAPNTCKTLDIQGFHLKAAGDEWSFSGTASTPTLDRQNDTVDPLGVKFTLPLPFLMAHDATQPIGQIVSATVDKSGIQVAGKITEPTADMPPGMAGRLREAWASITSGLIRGLSVGFIPKEYEPNAAGGFAIKAWEWIELSLVAIPAQPDAGVSRFKALPIAQPCGGFRLRSTAYKMR